MLLSSLVSSCQRIVSFHLLILSLNYLNTVLLIGVHFVLYAALTAGLKEASDHASVFP
jgi:hypothetical protein